MDETVVYKEIDFTEFERLFQVKRFQRDDDNKAKREACETDRRKREKNSYLISYLVIKKAAERITVIESNRARNLSKRKRELDERRLEEFRLFFFSYC